MWITSFRLLPLLLLANGAPLNAWAATPSAMGGTDAVIANSPFTEYTAGVAAIVFIVAFLVAVLLIGGILVVNLGLMSKRAEDRALTRAREPSDPAFLKANVYPEEPEVSKVFPAEDDDENTEEDDLRIGETEVIRPHESEPARPHAA